MQLLFALLGLAVLAAVLIKLLPWLLAAAALWACLKAARWVAVDTARRVAARQAAIEALIARCDQQHAWVLAGDDRGVYGQ